MWLEQLKNQSVGKELRLFFNYGCYSPALRNELCNCNSTKDSKGRVFKLGEGGKALVERGVRVQVY